MSNIENLQEQNIDQKLVSGQDIAETVLALADVAIKFAAVERVPRYIEEKRENNAEHSFMLGLIATELSERYFPLLDGNLVTRFALVHDLTELVTGDVATFNISEADYEAKKINEEVALDMLCDILPEYTASLLLEYEKQVIPEARFVRFVDKLLPVAVDILGPGSKVMHEDYDTFNHEQLAASENKLRLRMLSMFPEPEFECIHEGRTNLSDLFESVFVESSEQRKLF